MAEQIKVSVDGGQERLYPAGVTPLEIYREQGDGQKEPLAAVVSGEKRDLNTPLYDDCRLSFLYFEDEEGARIYRHSASHILAQAVQRLYPGVKLGIGPAIENGFYYDFEFEEPLTAGELEKIEREMKKIIKEKLPIERCVMSREEAEAFFREKGQPYKLELIADLDGDAVISCYRQGEFVDLCSGPHLTDTGKVKAVKLTGLAGAYWRGDERNPMLQRIYGTAFPSREQLEEHLRLLEEAKKRDHRKLGRDLDLFSLHEEGPGFPFFHNNGMILWQELTDFWRQEHRRAGYEEIRTPIILNRRLW
ncbi:MAG TPA: threonine--tRNA ligase, partial [Bacillota bacterium]|nr:threonine--tRNA ligase [Bacillota bacterium]